jgi:hypothetical protein
MSEKNPPPPRGANGRWRKGQDYPKGRKASAGPYGSPSLRRKLEGRNGHAALQKAFRSRSIAIMHALKRVALDPATPPAVKVAAVQLFLDRGWGKMDSDFDATAKKNIKKRPERPIVVVSHVPRKNDGT